MNKKPCRKQNSVMNIQFNLNPVKNYTQWPWFSNSAKPWKNWEISEILSFSQKISRKVPSCKRLPVDWISESDCKFLTHVWFEVGTIGFSNG